MGDGRLGKCKECTKSDTHANRSLKLDHYRAYDRARGNRQAPSYMKEYRRKNPDKASAHNKVSKAMMSGKLTKPVECWRCGSTDHIKAHHWDYGRPLDVEWVCSACHSQIHARINKWGGL